VQRKRKATYDENTYLTGSDSCRYDKVSAVNYMDDDRESVYFVLELVSIMWPWPSLFLECTDLEASV